ncbi:hypothetical protein GGR56DRAFT_633170 [Xylariaceae sp. FL0804]|nr:hypothetical protein GGR56DRAFT_633170 [Xylariaceae sp. FL0804]
MPPPPGSPPFGGTYQFGEDTSMPSFGINQEFDYLNTDDADHNTSMFDFPPSAGDTYDPILALISTPAAQVQGAAAPSKPGDKFSASHRGSSSSSSSQRSADSASPKTSRSSMDGMLVDDPTESWKFEHLGDQDAGFQMYNSIDPSVMGNSIFDFDGFASTSGGSSPSMLNGQSPGGAVAVNQNVPSRRSGPKRVKKDHTRHSQQSLKRQSMDRVPRHASRDISPSTNLSSVSQGSSPAAAFTNPNSPGADNNVNYFRGNMALNISKDGWPSATLRSGTYPSLMQPNPQIKTAQHESVFANHGPLATIPLISRPRLFVAPTPLKSRVETQIPIKLTIHDLPRGIKRVHLPMHTISKPKLLAKPQAVRSPDMLELYTMLVCTSAMDDQSKEERALRRAAMAPHSTNRGGADDEENKVQNGGEVRICSGCMQRERKRAGRKKHRKPEEEQIWNKFEKERAVVFNTTEVKDWLPVTPGMVNPTGALDQANVRDGTFHVDAPMRIACYCRHHGEKLGFKVIFTLKDYQDNLVAQSVSQSIMITDDHKTHMPAPGNPPAAGPGQNAGPGQTAGAADTSTSAPVPLQTSHSSSDIAGLAETGAFFSSQHGVQNSPLTATPRLMSRQGSPASSAGRGKKRKASDPSKVPPGLAMTRIETSQAPPPMLDTSGTTAASSPFSPELQSMPLGMDTMFPQGQHQAPYTMHQSYGTGPPTPSSNGAVEPLTFPSTNRGIGLDNLPMGQIYSAPTSAHPSRVPSPNTLQRELQSLQRHQMAPSVFNPTMNLAQTPMPQILRVIPNEGPKCGGVEVTVLGRNFTNEGLEVYFGEQKATTTTYWGETSLVCLLPPSPTARVVTVSVKRPGVTNVHHGNIQQPQTFKYIDDDEERLMRTALAVLGNKLSGGMRDVADVARNIIFSDSANTNSMGSTNSGLGGQAPSGHSLSLSTGPTESVETGLLHILNLIDLDDSVNEARINLRRANGQTMLHLACSLGYSRMVAGLLSRGALVDVRDKGGFTPLHLAALNNRAEIVRRLLMKGADPSVRTLSGLSSADIARSPEVLRALRGGMDGSYHSRVNSASSLRSLWDAPSVTPSHGEGYYSAGYSSSGELYDDSSEEEANSWLDMRRPSLQLAHRPSGPLHPEGNAADAGLASPGAAVAALRDQFAAQFQQLHHSMSLHFPNLPQLQMPNMPQMPQMPQMPHLPVMPVLPDYQAYLHPAPVMQRISSLVPNIRGQRPESTGASSPRDSDGKWWDLPFFGAKEMPPPAYEDIYPQKDLDTKQASAAQAAADFEADAKCAALYDQDQSVAESSSQAQESSSSQAQEVPDMLQIGRKHHITKEQQENLQRAHAQRLKTGSSDKMLWFVWIPMLLFVLGAMVLSAAPALREVGQRVHRLIQEVA